MGCDDAHDRPERITGLSLEDAVEVVVARDPDRDPETVRSVLDPVAEHGIVTEDALQARLAETAKVVSTPETHAELAAVALSDAREAASGVADLDVVAARLDDFESRLGRVEDEVTDLGAELQRLSGRAEEPGTVYETALGLRELTSEANRLQGAADQLGVDVEEFGQWVEDPDVRVDELGADVEAVDHSLDGLADDVDRLADRDGAEAEDGDRADSDVAWVDAAFRHRVLGLLIEDARAELDDLRTWARRAGSEDDRLEELEARLRAYEARNATLGGQLVSLARSEWVERYGDRLSAFESALESVDPPIDWNDVQATIDEHTSAIEDRSAGRD